MFSRSGNICEAMKNFAPKSGFNLTEKADRLYIPHLHKMIIVSFLFSFIWGKREKFWGDYVRWFLILTASGSWLLLNLVTYQGLTRMSENVAEFYKDVLGWCNLEVSFLRISYYKTRVLFIIEYLRGRIREVMQGSVTACSLASGLVSHNYGLKQQYYIA